MDDRIKFSKEASKYRGYQTSMEFLSPVGKLNPSYSLLDEVTNKIWTLMKNRNWDVPGITVTFDLYGGSDHKYKKVESIEGDDFLLKFGRVVGKASDRWNDVSACDMIVIPEFQFKY